MEKNQLILEDENIRIKKKLLEGENEIIIDNEKLKDNIELIKSQIFELENKNKILENDNLEFKIKLEKNNNLESNQEDKLQSINYLLEEKELYSKNLKTDLENTTKQLNELNIKYEIEKLDFIEKTKNLKEIIEQNELINKKIMIELDEAKTIKKEFENQTKNLQEKDIIIINLNKELFEITESLNKLLANEKENKHEVIQNNSNQENNNSLLLLNEKNDEIQKLQKEKIYIDQKINSLIVNVNPYIANNEDKIDLNTNIYEKIEKISIIGRSLLNSKYKKPSEIKEECKSDESHKQRQLSSMNLKDQMKVNEKLEDDEKFCKVCNIF